MKKLFVSWVFWMIAIPVLILYIITGLAPIIVPIFFAKNILGAIILSIIFSFGVYVFIIIPISLGLQKLANMVSPNNSDLKHTFVRGLLSVYIAVEKNKR